MRTLLHIGEVAQLLGVTPKTIRHYEKIGLLSKPERTQAGYRLYNAHDLLRLEMIKRLQTLGLSLKQIKDVLGEPRQAHSLRDVLLSLDQELDKQIKELEQRREKISALLQEDTISVERLQINSPSLELVKQFFERMQLPVSQQLWEQEARAYLVLDGFRWPSDQQQQFKEAVQAVVQNFADKPEAFQEMSELGERLVAVANLPKEAPEVQQLAEDFAHYLGKQKIFQEMAAQSAWQDGPPNTIITSILSILYTPSQLYVLQEATKPFMPSAQIDRFSD
ncbi:MerR family transcriptional regulator [Ktedonosporobacter rubrisoli]|uniref:MerR family transcriptional regulator n=1 Tax=Ktedonosporobacter rubrisoli TaxID=2509675 RepID=A0A4P6JYM7_KTERU|nr:MerR family transcriptional regulator [Ktedonosporobacter rubrisoli]QBD80918.1 MerR family transcriptional regulator [Ktedonosporobacter rubrisoli]